MAYELTGKVKLLKDAQTFASGFTKREVIVLDESGKYPQEISVEFLGDQVGLADSLVEGQEVEVTFDIRGREYDGRYFNSLVAWKVQAGQGSPNTTNDAQAANADAPVANELPNPDGTGIDEDVLPF